MKVFATLLSSQDYLDAVLVLNKSLQATQSKYPLLVMVTKSICSYTLELLQSQGILTEVVDDLQYSKSLQEDTDIKDSYILNTCSKFAVFNLDSDIYHKVVFIDADVLILDNIDSLMDFPDGSMLYINGENLSGLFVFEPQYHKEIDLYQDLIKYGKYLDGTILGQLWFVAKSNPAYQITEQYQAIYSPIDNSSLSHTKSIHFQGRYKPWDWLSAQNFYKQDCQFYQLYLSYLAEVKKDTTLFYKEKINASKKFI